MPTFSQRSLSKLSQCEPDIQTIFNEVIKYFDCSILVGHRNEEDQNSAFSNKLSQLKWPNSRHNSDPSMAIDVSPHPVDWKDIPRITYFAGIVKGIAALLFDEGRISHELRWGGDWDSDTELSDNKFNDLVHFELIPNK